MDVYLVPGMGSDARLFSRLDLGGHCMRPLRWAQPDPGDDLGDYAGKLLSQVEESEESALLGVSMGGMMAVEMAKRRTFGKLILVSSAKTKAEIPPYLRRLRNAGWRKKIKADDLIRLRHLIAPMMNLIGEGYRIFDEMLRDTDPAFLDWCIEAVLSWDNEQIPEGLVHFHGTADVVLPARYIKDYIPLSRGSHLMIYQRAGELSGLIKKELD